VSKVQIQAGGERLTLDAWPVCQFCPDMENRPPKPKLRIGSRPYGFYGSVGVIRLDPIGVPTASPVRVAVPWGETATITRAWTGTIDGPYPLTLASLQQTPISTAELEEEGDSLRHDVSSASKFPALLAEFDYVGGTEAILRVYAWQSGGILKLYLWNADAQAFELVSQRSYSSRYGATISNLGFYNQGGSVYAAVVGSPSISPLYVDWLNWHVVQDVDVQAVSTGPMPWGRNYAGQRFYLPTKMIITLTNCGSLSGTHEVPWQQCSGGWTYYWVTYPDDSYVACSYSYSNQVMGGADYWMGQMRTAEQIQAGSPRWCWRKVSTICDPGGAFDIFNHMWCGNAPQSAGFSVEAWDEYDWYEAGA
jgi:hypothetical protein